MTVRDNHSSVKLLTAIVGIFVILMGATAFILVLRAPHPFSVTLQPGATAARPALIARISYKGKGGQTALNLLKAQVHVSTRQSSYGQYIDSIDGIKSGTDGKYWAMYVNGSHVPVAANSYITRDGDEIEWRLE